MLNLKYLKALAERYASCLDTRVREFSLGKRLFRFNSGPAIMGVINLSPDSWYRESVCLSTAQAVRRARVLSAQGAHLIDVGAESTLPQAAVRAADAQNERLLPVIAGLKEQGLVVSVEAYHPEVARACLAAGADVVNLTGTQWASEIYSLAAEHEAGVILCYVEGRHVRDVDNFRLDDQLFARLTDYFVGEIDRAKACGVEKLVLDPGLGFYYPNLEDSARRVRHQIDVFLNSFRCRALGYPVCHALPHAFEHFGEEVRTAEPFFAVLAALGQTDLFRTHEVSKVKAVLDTLQTIPGGFADASKVDRAAV